MYSLHLTLYRLPQASAQRCFFLCGEKQLKKSPAKTDLGCSFPIFHKQVGYFALEP